MEWQILTKGGGVIPVDGLEELRNWKHNAMAVIGVSFRCQSWRNWDAFREVIRKSGDGHDAWTLAPLI